MRKVMCEHDEERKHCHYCHLDSQSHPHSILNSGETVPIPFHMSLEGKVSFKSPHLSVLAMCCRRRSSLS